MKNINQPSEKNYTAVMEKINNLECIADKIYHVKINPKISFNVAGRIGGKACGLTNEIRLNCQMLESNGGDFIDEVVPHEYAHLLAHKIYSHKVIKPHGIEWKNVSRNIGYIPSRTHNFEVEAAKVHKKFTYIMACGCTFYVGNKIHTAIQNGNERNYRCRLHKNTVQGNDWYQD
jgi:SprT protein